jgi:hypothetical protein
MFMTTESHILLVLQQADQDHPENGIPMENSFTAPNGHLDDFQFIKIIFIFINYIILKQYFIYYLYNI